MVTIMNRGLKGSIFLFLFGIFMLPGFSIAQVGKPENGSDLAKGRIQTDTSEINALLKRSENFRYLNPDSAIILAREAIELSNNLNYEAGKAVGFKILGSVSWDRTQFSQALEYFNFALTVYKEEKDTLGVSSIQNNIGAVYNTSGNSLKALDLYFESLRNAESAQDSKEKAKRVGTAYFNIGSVYVNDKLTYDQAIENYQKSIPYFEEIYDEYPLGLAAANVGIGETFLKKGQFASSLPYLNNALQDFRKVGIDPATPLNLLGQAYLKMNDLPRASEYYQQALASSQEKGSKNEEALAYLGLGNIDLQRNNPVKAVEFFNSALEVARESALLWQESEAYTGLSKAYAMRNDFENAFRAQQSFATVSDSLRNKDYADQMSKLRTAFDLEGKEKEIQLLNAQNALSQAQIEDDARAKRSLTIILFLFLAIIAGFIFQYFYIRRTNKRLAFERNRSDQILLNILPEEVADELKEKGFTEAKEFDSITVMFTDFKGFSLVAERISAEKLVKSVDYYFKHFDEIIDRHNLEKIKTIGDAYMCAGGLPTPNQTHARDAFAAAVDILQFVRKTELNPPKDIYPFQIRIGLSSGPVVAGVVGTKKFAYDIWGNTVNIAARMESGSVAGRINVAENIYDELKDDYEFTYRGELQVKSQTFKMYFAEIPEEVTA